MPEPLWRADGLRKSFATPRGRVVAVDGCGFTLRRGETLGLVGESGCGKSTLARLALHLIEPDAGSVRIDGIDFTHAGGAVRRRLRRRVQMVFQDALSSLNPRMTAGVNVAEPLRLQGIGTARTRRETAREMLELVGLGADDADRYPHQFSGGQCQRIAIARALALRPDVVVFDESVSALDVSIRAQILRLILDLQRQLGLACLFISHDLSVVRRMSDRIAVMYQGRIVEQGFAEELCAQPEHPYTAALIRAIPVADPRRMRVADLSDLGTERHAGWDGCAFRLRCPVAFADCATVPVLREVDPGHAVACHRATSAERIAA